MHASELPAALVQDLIRVARVGERRLAFNGATLLRHGFVRVVGAEGDLPVYALTSKALTIPAVAAA